MAPVWAEIVVEPWIPKISKISFQNIKTSTNKTLINESGNKTSLELPTYKQITEQINNNKQH